MGKMSDNLFVNIAFTLFIWGIVFLCLYLY